MSERLKKTIVHVSASLVEAMRVLDRSGTEIALAIDDESRLVGTLTDGDIRRALLSGAGMESPLEPHLHRKFVSVPPGTGRAEVLELMQARYIGQIPILAEDGRLVGLHLLHEVIGRVLRPNWVLVMAGGKGTRLRPYTENIPKPLLRVAGRPILERIVLHLVSHGIERIFLATHYLGHMVEDHFGDGSRFGCRIEYLREESPLGTGGALSLLPEPPVHPMLVMNGDLVTQANIGTLFDFHASGGQVATIGVRRYVHTVPFGCLELDGDRVVAMEEKPTLSQMINAGIYVLDPAFIATVPLNQEVTMPSLLQECMVRGQIVRAFHIEDDWIDVGQREQLSRAQGGTSQ